jgi:hypothetical protein
MTSHQDEPRRHAAGMPQAGDAAVPTAEAEEASNHLGQDDGADVARPGGELAKGPPPPHAPGGLATSLQPGGTVPDGGPGTSAGSIGTSGAAGGSAKRSEA